MSLKKDPDPDPGPIVRGMDPWIHIHTQMSRIRNTVELIQSSVSVDPCILKVLCHSQNFLLTRALLNLLTKDLGRSKPALFPH
jgi:hypothetical protein